MTLSDLEQQRDFQRHKLVSRASATAELLVCISVQSERSVA